MCSNLQNYAFAAVLFVIMQNCLFFCRIMCFSADLCPNLQNFVSFYRISCILQNQISSAE